MNGVELLHLLVSWRKWTEVRSKICKSLEFLGVKIDERKEQRKRKRM